VRGQRLRAQQGLELEQAQAPERVRVLVREQARERVPEPALVLGLELALQQGLERLVQLSGWFDNQQAQKLATLPVMS
jgi:hypothetical protein